MKKILNFFPLIIFFLVILSFFYFILTKKDPELIPSSLINKNVPEFSTLNLLNNKNFNLKKELGKKITIINFFASWCKPCMAEHKFIYQLSELKDIKVIGINYKDKKMDAVKWLIKHGNPYSSIALDQSGEIAIEWGVYGIPETYIVNDKNIIIHKIAGPLTKNNFENFLNVIKNEN